MTLKEKMDEICAELKPKCDKEGLNLLWEMNRAITKFRREHPDLDRQWQEEASAQG